MEISQKICKVVPYTTATDNKEYFTHDSDSSEDSISVESESHRTNLESGNEHTYATLFYNLARRDETIWDKIHVSKLIHHKPSGIMFMFCHKKEAEGFNSLM